MHTKDKKMKYKFVTLLLFLQTSVFCQDYQLYSLFNNQFQAVFPDEPVLFLNTTNVQSYIYADRKNSLGFLSKHLDYSVIKSNMFDFSQQSLEKNLFYLPAKKESHKILSIKSTKNSKNKTYTFYVLKQFQSDGITIYQYMKAILYNNHLYSCSLQYTNNKSKHIFESYQNKCKLLN